jgi:hypothetical protein
VTTPNPSGLPTRPPDLGVFPVLEDRRRLPTLPVAIAGLSAVIGVVWAAAELACKGTQTWTMNHPAFVTFAMGLILLILTVFAVERWLTWNESKHWRAPALAALDAYIQRASGTHKHLRREFRRLHGLSLDEFVPGVDLRVDLLLPDAAAEPFNVFAELVREQMTALAPVTLLTIQTAARHKPFEEIVGELAEQQRRLSVLATDSVALYAWAKHRDNLAKAGNLPDDVYSDGFGDPRDTARHMNEVFVTFSSQLQVLGSQVGGAMRALAVELAAKRQRRVDKRRNPGPLAHLRHPILAMRKLRRKRPIPTLEEVLPGFPGLEESGPPPPDPPNQTAVTNKPPKKQTEDG